MSDNKIPNPDNDLSEKANNAINFMVQTYEPQLNYLSNQLKYPDSPNTYRRILGFCVRIKQELIDQMGSKLNNDENLDECIKQMNNVSDKNSPKDKIQFLNLANEIASNYIQVYNSLS